MQKSGGRTKHSMNIIYSQIWVADDDWPQNMVLVLNLDSQKYFFKQ